MLDHIADADKKVLDASKYKIHPIVLINTSLFLIVTVLLSIEQSIHIIINFYICAFSSLGVIVINYIDNRYRC